MLSNERNICRSLRNGFSELQASPLRRRWHIFSASPPRLSRLDEDDIESLPDDRSFYSCDSPGRSPAIPLRRLQPRESNSPPSEKIQKRQNTNDAQHYVFLRNLLIDIVDGEAKQQALKEDRGIPLFVMAGACPNTFERSYQALLFCQIGSNVDAWWIKPTTPAALFLQKETLWAHKEGQFTNTTDRAEFKTFARMFANSEKDSNKTYGITSDGRAFIDLHQDGRTERMLVYLVWQEDWSLLKRYQSGKICYQKATPDESYSREMTLCARQYRITDAGVFIDERYEERIYDILPSGDFPKMVTDFQSA